MIRVTCLGGVGTVTGSCYLVESAEGKKVLIPIKHYFVLGDNSDKSLDSRYWGFLPEKNLLGKVTKIYWPFKRFGDVK